MKRLSRSCYLCCSSISSASVANRNGEKLKENLWRYLYHENVREAVAPSGLFTITDASASAQMEQNVKLTFALTVNTQTNEPSNNQVFVCQKCEKELENLKKLHHNLEEIKRKVDNQVKIIDKVRKAVDLQKPGSQNQLEMQNLSGIQMTFGGATMGVDNVHETLQFLDKMCKQFNSSPRSFQPRKEHHVYTNYDDNDPGTSSMSFRTTTINNEATDDMVSQIENSSSISEDASLLYPDVDISESSFSVKVDPTNSLEDFVSNVFSTAVDEQPQRNITTTTKKFKNPIELHNQLGFQPRNRSAPEPATNRIKMQNVAKRLTKPIKLQRAFTASSSSSSTNHRNMIMKDKQKMKTMKQCPICEKIMLTNNYAQHMRVHTGEKPYQCNICGMRFAQRTGYTTHKKNGHGHSKITITNVTSQAQVSDTDPLAE